MEVRTMLVDCYAREDVFAQVPELAAEIDPVLRTLNGLLDDDQLYQQVRTDFGKRHRSTLVHGRHSTPVEVLLRMLILKHLYQWSYKELEARVKDSLVLRWFCRVAFHAVPDGSTLWRWQQTLRPETVHALNDRVVQLAKQAKVTKGRKLRLDATCVQTEIHHPTDSGLLVDSVRVLSRFVQRAKDLVKDQASNVQQACRSRLRTARQVAQTLHRQLRRPRRGQRSTAERAVSEAHRDHRAHGAAKSTGGGSLAEADRAGGQASAHAGHRGASPGRGRDRPDAQTRAGGQEDGLRSRSVLSLFEPHTRAIPRHKGGALVEFGRHVILDETEGGIVTRYQILEHPTEHGQAVEAVAHHCALFAHPPGLVAGDRGVHSADTEEKLKAAGVKRVAIPASGKLSEERHTLEHTRTWKRGYRWRAGIEGRIASLRRDYGWRKSRYHGQDGMARWLGPGVIASNLRRIALASRA